ETKHCALANEASGVKLTMPVAETRRRPLPALQTLTGKYTSTGGRATTGSVKRLRLAPVVVTPPLSWTMPWLIAKPALAVLNVDDRQPLSKVRGVNSDKGNETPSREVKHWTLETRPPSAETEASPLGAMNRRPFVEPQRSMGR